MICACCCSAGAAKKSKLDEIIPEEFHENDDNLETLLKKYDMEFTGTGPDDAQCRLLKYAFEEDNKFPK
jgi:hypothetical protein